MEKRSSKHRRAASKKDSQRVSHASHFVKPRSPAASTFSKEDGKAKSIIGGSKKSSVLAEENKNTGMHKQPLGAHELDM